MGGGFKGYAFNLEQYEKKMLEYDAEVDNELATAEAKVRAWLWFYKSKLAVAKKKMLGYMQKWMTSRRRSLRPGCAHIVAQFMAQI